jgi:hypothetical protein
VRRGVRYLLAVGVLALTTAWPAGATSVVAPRTLMLAGAPRHLASVTWWGGTFAVPDGNRLTIYMSTRYPQSDEAIHRWVSFFTALPHGSELSLVTVYIAPLDEVEEACSTEQVLGCYGGQKLVFPGETVDGIAPTTVATHEYGHHIAANRNNAPWLAVDWGTKRWATHISICARVAAGTAFPGDEGMFYSLNPGEAFAETYRVLVEGGESWPIVDDSFRPDAAALTAVREDVLEPWHGPTTTTIKVKLPPGRRTWATTITAALDGDVAVEARGPVEPSLVSADGRRVLARAAWNGSGGKTIRYRDCGARSVRLVVRRDAPGTSFSLKITTP